MSQPESKVIQRAATAPGRDSGEPDADRLIRAGREVIETEARALGDLASRVDEAFVRACNLMYACRGRVVVTGMGKSGHVGRKIAATLASAGTPAFFLHPGEASHGDLGMITEEDVVLALSNSGDTAEILTILPVIKRLGVPFISLCGEPDSRIAKEADVNIDVSVEQEACPLGLAPTASTTAALAMGDALSIALLQARGFSAEDFARSHPGGRLGRRLLLHISDVMHTGDGIPAVTADAKLSEALMEMTRTRLGMTAIVDADRKVLGIFTDGDLRRAFERETDVHKVRISEVMTPGCTTVKPDLLAAEGLNIMQQRAINALLVLDENERLVGALNMHDLLRAGVL
ncbi:MAG: KpsF/GutQ family sugar-phosphate isomerase [Gammaproteobacteria bacterium]|nr:KpsF/GutQ family sugar-phosphate isomerase [Gammaproteobacteria bacterium]